MSHLLTTQKVAELTNWKARTIRNWCQQGNFKTAMKLTNKIKSPWLIDSKDLFLKQLLELKNDSSKKR